MGRLRAPVDLDDFARMVARGVVGADDLREPLADPGDPRHHLALVAVERASVEAEDAARLRRLAAMLPRRAASEPAASILLARLIRRLWRFLDGRRLPAIEAGAQSPAARIEWLRTELCVEPTAALRRGSSAAEQALESIALDDVDDPAALIDALATGGEAALEERAAALLEVAIARAAVSPAAAHGAARRLLRSDAPRAQEAALRALASSWSFGHELHAEELAATLRGGEAIAGAALRCAAARGLEGPVWALVDDASAPPRLRQEALRELGSIVGKAAIPGLVERALADPPLLGVPCFDALERLHRRGLFVDDGLLPGVVALFAATPDCAGERLVELTYTARAGLLSLLSARDQGGVAELAPRRWVEVVRALAATPLGDGSAAAELLTARLDDASAGAAALDALARLGHPRAEELALGRLDEDAAAALVALRRVGGAATIEVLRARLGIAPEGPVAASILGRFTAAVELLWQLCADDREARDQLLARLGDRDLTAALVGDLGGGLSRREALALGRRERAPVGVGGSLAEEVAAVDGLARLDSAAVLPAIQRHLRSIVAAVADGEVYDAELRGEARRVVPARVLAALRGLGVRLKRRGRIRPAALIDARSEAQAGDVVIAELLLEQLGALDDADVDERGRVEVILRSLADVDDPRIYRRVLPLLRSSAPTIRKLVIPRIARFGGAALATSLRLRVAAEDIETVRQAVIALGEVGGEAAAATLAQALEHRNMNIKKAAAAGLVRSGGREAIPRLLFWLGHHDNPGLRALLSEALAAIVGEALPLTLLGAIADAEDGRRRGLLLDALPQRLDPLALRVAARSDEVWAAGLCARVADGRIASSRSLPGVRAEIAAAAGAEARGEVSSPAAFSEIERRGLTDAAVGGLIELRRRRSFTGAERAQLRPFLRGLLGRAAAVQRAGEDAGEHVRLVVEAIEEKPRGDEARRLFTQREPLLAGLAAAEAPLAGRIFALIDATIAALGPSERWLFGQDVAAIVDTVTNRWERSPLALLRRCGRALTRADVEAALRGCRRSADPAGLRRRILADAFLHRESASGAGALKKPAQERLAAALADPSGEALGELRRAWEEPPRPTIAALIDASSGRDGDVSENMLSWLCALQPPGAPLRWATPASPTPSARRPAAADLDQPVSLAQLARLRRDLENPVLAAHAGMELLERTPYIDDALRAELLRRYLDGDLGPATRLSGTALDVLAEALKAEDVPSTVGARRGDFHWLNRLLRLVRRPAARGGGGLLAALVDAWPRAPEEGGARRTIRAMIDAYPADAVRVALQEPLLRGEWGYLDLIRRPQRPSTLDAALREAARRHGDGSLVARVDALRDPPAVLSVSAPLSEPERAAPPDARPRDELFALLRAADKRGPAEALTQALRELGRRPDDAFVALCRDLVDHPHPRLRLAAYRQLRRHGSREDAGAAARKLLDDPRPDIQRAAIASLGHARDADALPAIIRLLDHRHNGVRRAALAALRLYGADARGAVEGARRGARPDRRRALDEVLAALDRDDG